MRICWWQTGLTSFLPSGYRKPPSFLSKGDPGNSLRLLSNSADLSSEVSSSQSISISSPGNSNLSSELDFFTSSSGGKLRRSNLSTKSATEISSSLSGMGLLSSSARLFWIFFLQRPEFVTLFELRLLFSCKDSWSFWSELEMYPESSEDD